MNGATRRLAALVVASCALALPACSSGTSPSASPTLTAEAFPSATTSLAWLVPVPMPARLVGADDSTLLAAAENPRTGETWFDDAADDDPGVPILVGNNDDLSLAHVGRRDDAEIYVVVDSNWDGLGGGSYVTSLVEVREGHAFLVACPNPTEPACPQQGISAATDYYGFDETVLVDGDVFYDSLGLPSVLVLANGLDVIPPRVGDVTEDGLVWTWLGDAWSPVAGIEGDRYGPPSNWPETEVHGVASVADVGSWSLVSYETMGSWGLPTVNVAWIAPFGATYAVRSTGDATSLSAEDVRWDDGFEPVAPEGYRLESAYRGAGVSPCDFDGLASRDPHRDDAAWQPAGRLPRGGTVYVPVEGGNEWSGTIWDAYVASRDADPDSSTYDPTEVAFLTTEEAFLSANALIEIEGLDGEWWMLVSEHASSYVPECFG